jgi:hypothetical protein
MTGMPSLIEITALPHGDAPEWVRQAWVGCVLPCIADECGHIPKYVESVLPRTHKGPLKASDILANPDKFKTLKIAGFDVPQDIALQVLAVHSPQAAQWFEQQGFPREDKCFRFKHEEVTVLQRASSAGPTRRYDDLETGTMRPMT